MSERLSKLTGNYRFLIPAKEKILIIGNPTLVKNPNHADIAKSIGLDPKSVRGGCVEIGEKGTRMAFCGGAFSVPEASEEDFNEARAKGVRVIP